MLAKGREPKGEWNERKCKDEGMGGVKGQCYIVYHYTSLSSTTPSQLYDTEMVCYVHTIMVTMVMWCCHTHSYCPSLVHNCQYAQRRGNILMVMATHSLQIPNNLLTECRSHLMTSLRVYTYRTISTR